GGVTAALLRSALSLESWTYRDAPDYGSSELDTRNEDTSSILVIPDRKTLYCTLAPTEQPKVHPHQTARIYHLKLASGTLFDGPAPQQLDAYYTLKRFAAK